jgi:hypothetical protein
MSINPKELGVTNAPPLSVVDDSATVERLFTIRPAFIDLDRNPNFDNSFADANTAAAAKLIVRFCQQLGGWFCFTLEELIIFEGRDFDFHGLLDYLYAEALSDDLRVDSGLVVYGADSRFRVTAEFVYLCYRAAYVPDVPESVE